MNTASIELLILDVDGVLTDGSVWFASDGEATKGFNVHDGSAIKLWRRSGGTEGVLFQGAHGLPAYPGTSPPSPPGPPWREQG